MMNIHFSFFCRSGRSNSKGYSPIVLRIIYRQERRDLYTGLYCNKEHWEVDAGLVSRVYKPAVTINQNLEQIRYKAMQALDELKFSKEVFTIDDLANKIKGKEEKPDRLIDYLKTRNKELHKKAGVDITHATYEKYERILRYMIEFLEDQFKVRNYPLTKMNGKFLEDYFHYLRTVKQIANNTAVKYMSSLKTILMPAIKGGTIRPDPYGETKFRSKVIYKGFLTDEEIAKLIEVVLDSHDLDRIRDQYLFC